MIRLAAALALATAFFSSPALSQTEDSADPDPALEVQGPPLPVELEVLVDPVELESDTVAEDDLEEVETSTHRLLELVADQVAEARPDLAEEVLEELGKTEALRRACHCHLEDHPLELEDGVDCDDQVLEDPKPSHN